MRIKCVHSRYRVLHHVALAETRSSLCAENSLDKPNLAYSLQQDALGPVVSRLSATGRQSITIWRVFSSPFRSPRLMGILRRVC